MRQPETRKHGNTKSQETGNAISVNVCKASGRNWRNWRQKTHQRNDNTRQHKTTPDNTTQDQTTQDKKRKRLTVTNSSSH
ncbi:MAG: hypothetical protein MUR45_00620, partial [OM182 bacterium]|nr:hypothetical protein [OM182 bacterium]